MGQIQSGITNALNSAMGAAAGLTLKKQQEQEKAQHTEQIELEKKQHEESLAQAKALEDERIKREEESNRAQIAEGVMQEQEAARAADKEAYAGIKPELSGIREKEERIANRIGSETLKQKQIEELENQYESKYTSAVKHMESLYQNPAFQIRQAYAEGAIKDFGEYVDKVNALRQAQFGNSMFGFYDDLADTETNQSAHERALDIINTAKLKKQGISVENADVIVDNAKEAEKVKDEKKNPKAESSVLWRI